MEVMVGVYGVYVAVSLGLVIWVGRTLAENGQVFLDDVFHGDERLAVAVNRLLVVGFYLVNLGYVSLALRIQGPIQDLRGGIEALSVQLGGVLLVLGALHLFNVLVLQRFRRRRLLESEHAPPVAPTGWAPASAAPAVAARPADGRDPRPDAFGT